MNLAGRIAMALARGWSRVAPTGRGGYRVSRLTRRFIHRDAWNAPFAIPGGIRLKLDLATYPDCCMACGLYELDTCRLIRGLLSPGMHFVDGGANLGYFTVLAARRVGPTGRVDAFEPDPANRARLEEHLAMNNVATTVRIHPCALSEQPGEATLYHPIDSDLNHGQASLYAPPAAPQSQQCTVSLARADELVDRIPDLVKLDIEGAEIAAIRGMSRWLASPRPPLLIIEHNPETSKIAGWAPGDILRTLHEFQPRYTAQWIGWGPNLPSAESIDAINRQGNILYQVTHRS